jgi:hypothetical protein
MPRATLLGAFIEIADRLRGSDEVGDDPRQLATRWRRRGLRIFDADRQAATANNAAVGPDERAEPS